MSDLSWTYGELPEYEELVAIIEKHVGTGGSYPMSFLETDEDVCVVNNALFDRPRLRFSSWVEGVNFSRVHFSLPPRSLASLLQRLTKLWDEEIPTDSGDRAGSLTSAILQTLGCEWV